MMKALTLACLVSGALAFGCAAAEAPAKSLDECLQRMETLIGETEAAQLLDDQVDEAEVLFGQMERSCYDSQFPEAAAAVDALQRILSSNK